MATQQEYERILAELRKRRDERPELAPIIEPHYELLTARAKTGAPPVHLNISQRQAKESLREGLPLLRRVGFELDLERFPLLFGEICQIAAHHRPRCFLVRLSPALFPEAHSAEETSRAFGIITTRGLALCE